MSGTTSRRTRASTRCRARSSTSTTVPSPRSAGSTSGCCRLLDLMSSWRSHLPYGLEAEVVGLGLNAEEMADNPQLARHVVHDVNDETAPLPFEDETFDGAMCAVSIQYVTRPVRVFREVRRILKVDAPFVVSCSNRCFPTKAVAVGLNMTDA